MNASTIPPTSSTRDRRTRPRSSRRGSVSAILASASLGVTGVVENIRGTPVAMLMSAPQTGRGGRLSAVALRARLRLVRRLRHRPARLGELGVRRALGVDRALLLGLGGVVVVHQALGLG